jgi:hypothetical protein
LRFSSSVPGNFLFSGLPGTVFLFHFNWNIFMKFYAGNWQINRNLGFRSGIVLSFDFVNFVIKKNLVQNLPSRPCLASCHVGEVLLFHWPFKGILSQYFFRHPISAITIDLSVSGIGFHNEIKWQSNTGQSVLKSKGFYRTSGHFTRLVWMIFFQSGESSWFIRPNVL